MNQESKFEPKIFGLEFFVNNDDTIVKLTKDSY